MILLAFCAAFLAVRATLQPVYFDFDEPRHVNRIVKIRELGPFPTRAELVQAGNPWAGDYLAPGPYVIAAGVTALVGAPADPESIRPIGRALSLITGILTVAAFGMAVRAHQPAGQRG